MELWPHWSERLAETLDSAHTRWDFWPSFRDLLEGAGVEIESPGRLIEDAVASIWGHLDRGSDLTLLGGRIFDSLGGWEVIGAQAMDQGGRKHWDRRFWQTGKALLKRDEERGTLPALPPSPDVPEDDPQRGVDSIEAYLRKKEEETHQLLLMPKLDVPMPYEDRKARALEEGKDYWEPPRSWEIDRPLTPEERRLWVRKLSRGMRGLTGRLTNGRNREDCGCDSGCRQSWLEGDDHHSGLGAETRDAG